MDRSLRQSQASCTWVSFITDECSKSEILSRIAQTTAALTRLKPVLNHRSISLSSKIRLLCTRVTFIFLYACEPWTLTAELPKRIQAMEMRCYRKMKILCILHKDRVTNEETCAQIKQAIGHTKTWPSYRNANWGGMDMSPIHQVWPKTILQGTAEMGGRQGRQKQRWEDNIGEWAGLEFGKSQRAVENREKWRRVLVMSSVVTQWPSRLRYRWRRKFVLNH